MYYPVLLLERVGPTQFAPSEKKSSMKECIVCTTSSKFAVLGYLK
jgi:hypothetical protein